MKLPFNMRASTLNERKQFYEHFKLKNTREWTDRDLVYAIILGKHTNIILEKYKEDKTTPLIIDNYQSLQEVEQKILQYLPEGVFYDRNYYRDLSLCHSKNLRNAWNWDNFIGQELAFDIDSENVDCPIHGTLKERMKKGRGLSFCEDAFTLAKQNTIDLYENLSQHYNDVRITFSGRGFHIHVFDEETIYYSRKKREQIAATYGTYGIDKWVTTGEMRLIRLPFSLNAISSRIVTPLKKEELKQFDPAQQSLSDFISD